MDTTLVSDNMSQNSWSIYLLYFLLLVALFFVQKYAYLLDRKFNQFAKTGSAWEGKPWPFLAALTLGLLTYLYTLFIPGNYQKSLLDWGLAEWILTACCAVLLSILIYESISHFGNLFGLIRFLVIGLLAVVFYFAGLIAGLIMITILALGILFYFINFWRKRISIQ